MEDQPSVSAGSRKTKQPQQYHYHNITPLVDVPSTVKEDAGESLAIADEERMMPRHLIFSRAAQLSKVTIVEKGTLTVGSSSHHGMFSGMSSAGQNGRSGRPTLALLDSVWKRRFSLLLASLVGNSVRS